MRLSACFICYCMYAIVAFQVVDGPSAGLDQEEPESLELLTGQTLEDVAAKNQAPIDLSLPQASTP